MCSRNGTYSTRLANPHFPHSQLAKQPSLDLVSIDKLSWRLNTECIQARVSINPNHSARKIDLSTTETTIYP